MHVPIVLFSAPGVICQLYDLKNNFDKDIFLNFDLDCDLPR